MSKAHISFDDFLQLSEKGVLVRAAEKVSDNPRLHIVKIANEDERIRVEDTLNFFWEAFTLINDYPSCREMIIDAVHKYEKTHLKFQVCYNRIEDEKLQGDTKPISLYFPED